MNAFLNLEDFFSRSRIPPIIYSLNSHCGLLSDGHNKQLFRRSSVKYRTFSEGPTWSDLFPLCSKKKWKTAVNCPKIVAYMVKIVKFLVCVISEHPQKAISLMIKTWWTLFSSETEVGRSWPPGLPVTMPLTVYKILITEWGNLFHRHSKIIYNYNNLVLRAILRKYALYLGKFWSRVWSVPGPLFHFPPIAKRCAGEEVDNYNILYEITAFYS